MINRGMLMTVGHYHGYPMLPLKPGVSIAEGYAAWRTFTRDSREQWLELAADAMWVTWPDDPMIHDLVYVEPEPPADDDYSLEKLLAGCCTPGKPCPDHIDDVIEDWQDARLDRHLEGE